MKLEIKDIEFTKAEERAFVARIKENMIELLYDDIGYDIASKVIKKNKKRLEDEMISLLDKDYKGLARKVVLKKLGIGY